jgi:osmotically-inducible protein OsmY
MRRDEDIQRDVQDELRWDPQIDETDIAVKVNEGVVTLTGFVRSCREKCRAEHVAKRVSDVAGIANDVSVRLSSADKLDDPQIARAAVAAIRADSPAISEQVRLLVHRGRITLEGTVEWKHQHDRIEATVRHVRGVTGVNNNIVVTPRVEATDIQRLIEEAFRRSAEVDAARIHVETDGGDVLLTGKVRTWAERTEAQNTAWAAPGVAQVRNEITVGK